MVESGIIWKQRLALLRDRGSILDSVLLYPGLFEAMQRLEDFGPFVACQVVLNHLNVELSHSIPPRGGKFDSIGNIVSGGVHVITSFYLNHKLETLVVDRAPTLTAVAARAKAPIGQQSSPGSVKGIDP